MFLAGRTAVVAWRGVWMTTLVFISFGGQSLQGCLAFVYIRVWDKCIAVLIWSLAVFFRYFTGY